VHVLTVFIDSKQIANLNFYCCCSSQHTGQISEYNSAMHLGLDQGTSSTEFKS